MRKRFQSGLRGLLSGGLWGGIVGAILFGLRAYFSDSSSTLGGADRNWTGLFMIVGLVCGLVVGAILGAVIGAIQADKRTSILIGLAVGFFLAVGVTYGNFDLLALGVIVSCSIVGWLISSTLQARDLLG